MSEHSKPTQNQRVLDYMGQLKTIYSQLKNHRLPEWRQFCQWVEGLPHSDFITGKELEIK